MEGGGGPATNQATSNHKRPWLFSDKNLYKWSYMLVFKVHFGHFFQPKFSSENDHHCMTMVVFRPNFVQVEWSSLVAGHLPLYIIISIIWYLRNSLTYRIIFKHCLNTHLNTYLNTRFGESSWPINWGIWPTFRWVPYHQVRVEPNGLE